MTNRHLALAAACCLLTAVASLAIAREPVYDAWAWLVWGRELAGLRLDTSSGPSFKPLPVALTALASLAADAAPALWIALVRAAWLLALVLAGALAWRLADGLDRRPRVVAGAFAALSLALLRDDITMWARQGAAGMSEPLLVALVLGAVAAALEGRSRLALALGGLAALLRPEAWPLLAAFGLWRWRAEPELRPWIAALAVAVPALWIGPDVLGSGGDASAGERARRASDAPPQAFLEVLGRAALMPLAVAWPLALLAVARARGLMLREALPARSSRPRDGALLALAAGALAWIAIVAVMAGAGFAGLPRFMAPAIAVVGVLAGVGLAHAPAFVRRPRSRAALAVALLALTLVQLPDRAAQLPHAIASTARIARSHDDLRTLTRTVGRERLLRCGRLATSDVLVRTALAWELGVPLGGVVSFGDPPRASGAFVVGPQASALVRAFMRGHAELLGARGEWRVYSLDCSRTGVADSSSSASVRSAGVWGAQR